MIRLFFALLSLSALAGCVSLEMPENLVSDTAKVAKDAYHAVVGKESEESTSNTQTAEADKTAITPRDAEYEYIFVGDEGISPKEAKAACLKNASLLARRGAGNSPVQPRLLSEKVELEGDNIVVTCRVARN